MKMDLPNKNNCMKYTMIIILLILICFVFYCCMRRVEKDHFIGGIFEVIQVFTWTCELRTKKSNSLEIEWSTEAHEIHFLSNSWKEWTDANWKKVEEKPKVNPHNWTQSTDKFCWIPWTKETNRNFSFFKFHLYSVGE
jgi:hypothetical protein